MGKTVVLDGDLSLLVSLDGEMSLTSVMDGESGIMTKVAEIPSNYGLITWDGSVLTVS